MPLATGTVVNTTTGGSQCCPYYEHNPYVQLIAAGASSLARTIIVNEIRVTVQTNGAKLLLSPSPAWNTGWPTTVGTTWLTEQGTPLSTIEWGALLTFNGTPPGTEAYSWNASGSEQVYAPPGGIALSNGQKLGVFKLIGQSSDMTVTFNFSESSSLLTLPTVGDVRVTAVGRGTQPAEAKQLTQSAQLHIGRPQALRRSWQFETHWYTKTECEAIENALLSAPVISVSGDLISLSSAMNVHAAAVALNLDGTTASGYDRSTVSFTLINADPI